MKKNKIELLITVVLSVLAWVYFYLFSKKLDGIETVLVVGVIFLIVFIVGFIVRKFFKNEEK
ncbi:hypothetical protein D1164_10370 [Mariniphaga sediminis]|jgi:Flp pilus assembly protein protease CpaA|uniref:Uncharacterized protein n=1 Tax=Mariniphaga sediminis TaxID=1628158 RepID=A0A399D222_9BACT|nr:hypothetical protein D1164_10370 [Mariniphaga sediminis]